MAGSIRRHALISRALLLLAGHYGAGCSCPGVGLDRFTSGEAIDNASCFARDWRGDAILHSVYSSRDTSSSFGGAAGGWTIDHDGMDTTWTVIFTSESATCGAQHWRTRTFTVSSSGTTASDDVCSPVTWTCDVGLPSMPVDSSVVVPRGLAGISAMPGFDASNAAFMVEDLYDCGNVNGELVNRQGWHLWAYWTRPGETWLATARFGSGGKLAGLAGPCPFGDDQCLQQ